MDRGILCVRIDSDVIILYMCNAQWLTSKNISLFFSFSLCCRITFSFMFKMPIFNPRREMFSDFIFNSNTQLFYLFKILGVSFNHVAAEN